MPINGLEFCCVSRYHPNLQLRMNEIHIPSLRASSQLRDPMNEVHFNGFVSRLINRAGMSVVYALALRQTLAAARGGPFS